MRSRSTGRRWQTSKTSSICDGGSPLRAQPPLGPLVVSCVSRAIFWCLISIRRLCGAWCPACRHEAERAGLLR
jgi:hypothetical protein